MTPFTAKPLPKARSEFLSIPVVRPDDSFARLKWLSCDACSPVLAL
jgi:hypothetical protein